MKVKSLTNEQVQFLLECKDNIYVSSDCDLVRYLRNLMNNDVPIKVSSYFHTDVYIDTKYTTALFSRGKQIYIKNERHEYIHQYYYKIERDDSMIEKKDFMYGYEVVEFCNEKNITKEKIIALIYREDKMFCYELFYECNV